MAGKGFTSCSKALVTTAVGRVYGTISSYTPPYTLRGHGCSKVAKAALWKVFLQALRKCGAPYRWPDCQVQDLNLSLHEVLLEVVGAYEPKIEVLFEHVEPTKDAQR